MSLVILTVLFVSITTTIYCRFVKKRKGILEVYMSWSKFRAILNFDQLSLLTVTYTYYHFDSIEIFSNIQFGAFKFVCIADIIYLFHDANLHKLTFINGEVGNGAKLFRNHISIHNNLYIWGLKHIPTPKCKFCACLCYSLHKSQQSKDDKSKFFKFPGLYFIVFVIQSH